MQCQSPAARVQAFWRAAVAPMQLEQGQQEQMLYVASMFMTSMAQIDVQHGELSRRVLELLPQASGKRRYVSIVKLAETMLSVQQCAFPPLPSRYSHCIRMHAGRVAKRRHQVTLANPVVQDADAV